jgi:hypothetical protein
MRTKTEMIAILKKENPTLQAGDDERGYAPLSDADYEAQIEMWADNRLAKEAEAEAKAQAAADKAALLVKLGITADEAALLLA